MTITETEFKARCSEILRGIEETGVPVTIVRQGSIVAVIYPAHNDELDLKPWHRLRGTASLLAAAGESVITDDEFEALRN